MTDQSDQSKCDKPWNHFFQGQSFILFMLPLSFLFLPYIYHSYAHHLSLKYLPFLTLPSLTLSFYLGNRNNLFFLVLCIGMFFFLVNLLKFFWWDKFYLLLPVERLCCSSYSLTLSLSLSLSRLSSYVGLCAFLFVRQEPEVHSSQFSHILPSICLFLFTVSLWLTSPTPVTALFYSRPVGR